MAKVYTWVQAIGSTQQHLEFKGQRTIFSVWQGRNLWVAVQFGWPQASAIIGRGTQAQAKILAIRAHKAALAAPS